MKGNDREEELIGQFFESFVPSAESAIFRVMFCETPVIGDISYIKDRVVEDVEIVDDMLPILTELAELKRAEISEKIGPDKRMPKLMILESYGNGQRQRYEYNDINALSISKNDLGKDNSYYHPFTIILPDEITNKAKDEFSSSKEVDSEWMLTSCGSESKQVSMSNIKWDHRLRMFKKPTAEKWLLQTASSTNTNLSKISGLKLTLYKDNTFYDEAVNKNLDIPWINNDGELNSYHWVSHGNVNTFKGRLFLVPTEHSEIGTPEKDELKYVRYNDYDTKVVDTIEICEDSLYRCVSVLTDGIYLNRYMYVYSKM